MIEKFRIQRTGKSCISFEGECVAVSYGRVVGGKEQVRWHDLALYRTTAGNYVASVDYITRWDGELGWSEAEVVPRDKVESFFMISDPTEHVQGFPAGKQYEVRQRNLLDWIRTRYESQVSDLLKMCDDLDEVVA